MTVLSEGARFLGMDETGVAPATNRSFWRQLRCRIAVEHRDARETWRDEGYLGLRCDYCGAERVVTDSWPWLGNDSWSYGLRLRSYRAEQAKIQALVEKHRGNTPND